MILGIIIGAIIVFALPPKAHAWVRGAAGRAWERVTRNRRTSTPKAAEAVSEDAGAIDGLILQSSPQVRPNGRNSRIKGDTAPANTARSSAFITAIEDTRRDNGIIPPPPNKPIEVLAAPAPSNPSDGAKTRKPVQWGAALANIIARNPVLVWVLIVLAAYLMIVGLRSPFDLFGPSKDELRAELRQAEAALKLAREAGDIALEEGERFRADVHNLSQSLDQGRDAIHAASTHETRDLFLAWAASDRGLCASAGGC